jgi:uncharacterized coiled-coil protein SlyX
MQDSTQASLKTQIAELQASKSNLAARMDALDARLNDLEERFFGDFAKVCLSVDILCSDD